MTQKWLKDYAFYGCEKVEETFRFVIYSNLKVSAF